MIFNLQKFLVENKLTKRSLFKEDGMTKTNAEKMDMQDQEMFGGEEEDFEEEPTIRDIRKDEPSLSGIYKKQADLKNLESKKDVLLMQLKSGQIGLDQYKAAIGNIPTQIKKLRADIDKAMEVSLDDEEELT
jgi:hypothetical protein